MSNQKNNIYQNYYSTHSEYLHASNSDRKRFIQNIKYKINPHIKWILKDKDISNIRILDIWCGQWYFAEYCKNRWVKHFTGFDLDSHIVDYCAKILPEYTFSDKDIYEHLLKNKNTYDIVFMSHVFEHLSLEEWIQLTKLIYWGLKKWWQWVNIMPNASSIFFSWYLRYNDITHKTLYTENSFNQVLLNNFTEENIVHKNYITWNKTIKGLIVKVMSYIWRMIIRSMWFGVPKIYSLEIISIIKI